MGKPMVLFVDDETVVLNSLMMQMRKGFNDNFNIEISTNAIEALEILQEAVDEGEDVPLIISDFLMPMMKGDEFLAKAHEISPYSRNVLLTGHATLESVTSAINNANLFKYMNKPWQENDFNLTVQKATESFYQEKQIIELSNKNRQLYEKMRAYFVTSISALSGAIDAKDESTSSHSSNVCRYALMLGERIKFNEQELENLEYMCILHDIGKIGIPDSILTKPGCLTEGEYSQIKRHVKIGTDILSKNGVFDDLFPGIINHHERYDGKGYPMGNKGEDIPLEARIICLADAYDAMTSDRPYRKAFTMERAVKELQANAGRQFDPQLVEIFIEMIEKAQ